jgi:hypothetical protein
MCAFMAVRAAPWPLLVAQVEDLGVLGDDPAAAREGWKCMR